jgi:phage terminase large subunit
MIKTDFPRWAQGLFKPYRYKVLYGGRGSGKSFAVADYLIVKAATSSIRILCAREFQNSLADSVHHLLAERIEALGLASFFDIQRETIIGKNGSQFIFKGVRNNTQSIKSMSGINCLWLEEAQTVTKSSWDVLIPTIREPGSEILVTFNPHQKTDPTYQMFIADTPDDAFIAKVNWRDNPHWPDELEKERVKLQQKDPNLYAHVYEGECLEITDAQVFKGCYEVKDFTPQDNWDGPYYGLDFGFSQDKTAANKLWIADGCLWVEQEAGKKGLELDATANHLKRFMPGIENHTIRADSARPESISYLKRHGLPSITGVKKGKGSVEDGISFIKSFDGVIIHPSCVHTIEEFRLYSYKTDRLSGDVLPVLVDDNNHHIDAIRYALEPLMRNKQVIFEAL